MTNKYMLVMLSECTEEDLVFFDQSLSGPELMCIAAALNVNSTSSEALTNIGFDIPLHPSDYGLVAGDAFCNDMVIRYNPQG